MNEASSRFLSRATRGVRFLCRVMAEHCNGSGHVPGCDKGGNKPLASNIPTANHDATSSWDTKRYSNAEKKKLVTVFSAHRKETIAETNEKISGEIRVNDEFQKVTITKSSIKEIYNNKALWSTLAQGGTIEAHIEAANRTRELLPGSVMVGRGPDEKGDPNVKEKVYFERAFKAADGETYTARFMLKVFPKPKMLPTLYFMNCRK